MKWDAELYQNSHEFVADYGRGLLDFIPTGQIDSILDLGCGTGVLTQELALLADHVLGVDSSSEMIKKARALYPDLDFAVQDACALSMTAQFDVVFSNAVFHWINDQPALLSSIHKALKPAGLLICEFGARGNIAQIEGAFARSCAQVGHHYASPFFFPKTGEYTAILQEHGFMPHFVVDFDRPTPLSNGEQGLKQWMCQFFAADLERLAPSQCDAVLEDANAALLPALWDGDHFIADYRRLRVVAQKI